MAETKEVETFAFQAEVSPAALLSLGRLLELFVRPFGVIFTC